MTESSKDKDFFSCIYRGMPVSLIDHVLDPTSILTNGFNMKFIDISSRAACCDVKTTGHYYLLFIRNE